MNQKPQTNQPVKGELLSLADRFLPVSFVMQAIANRRNHNREKQVARMLETIFIDELKPSSPKSTKIIKSIGTVAL